MQFASYTENSCALAPTWCKRWLSTPATTNWKTEATLLALCIRYVVNRRFSTYVLFCLTSVLVFEWCSSTIVIVKYLQYLKCVCWPLYPVLETFLILASYSSRLLAMFYHVRLYPICIFLYSALFHVVKSETLNDDVIRCFLPICCLSVTRVCCDKTAEANITRFLLESSEMS